jgi:PKD repeat protein
MDANGNPYARIRPRSDDQDLDICENLYAEVTATSAPYWAYDHERPVVPGEDCALDPDTGEPAGNQISGIAFYPATGSFPAAYRRALFFADRWRNCIYAMLPGPDGVPDRGQVVPFAQQAGEPFAIEIAPGGDMLYVDRIGDAVRRVSFPGGPANQAPTAEAQADATSGNVPLTVGFDGSGSSDPDAGDVLVYEWDLDGDGELDDSTEPQPTFTYMQTGTFTVTLRVTDTSGGSDTDTLDITVTSGPAPGTQTLTFAPEADVRAEAAQPASNFGTENRLRTDDTEESFLRFQVAGITGRVTSAKLRLRSITDTGDGPAVRGTSNDWSETALTWSNRPSPTTAATGDAGAIGTNEWAEWDVTALLSADGPLNLHLSQPGSDGLYFHSREASTPSNRPQLVVTVSNDAYARPQGASPLRASLVPAYEPCTSPNREHGPPLAHPACSPPERSSQNVTIGTQDANGRPAAFAGMVRYAVRPGIAATPEDEADVTLDAQVSDVHDATSLLPYVGELQLQTTLRATDRGSGPAQDEPATTQEVTLAVTLPCTAELDLGAGAVCTVSTTLDAVLPGVVKERARSIWQLGQIEVFDGGPDGDVDTAGNAVFARQGVFIP